MPEEAPVVELPAASKGETLAVAVVVVRMGW